MTNGEEPAGARYSGGEPEPEVSDVGQAEAWHTNNKALFDSLLNWLSTDANALDAFQEHVRGQSMSDKDENRRNRDPLLDMRMRHAEDLHNQYIRQVDQGFQHTQQVGSQAIQNSLNLQAILNVAVLKDMLNSTEGERIARDRTWTLTEGFEANVLRQLEDAVVEAIRSTPMGGNQAS